MTFATERQRADASPVAAGPAGAVRNRLDSVDVLRGAIMIIMALDHVREFFGAAPGGATDLASTTVPLFFTRWVTHFCAPVFFLLTGTGAFLALRRKSTAELSKFLFARGVWLIVLEIVVVRCFALQFNVDYRVTMLTVLWALGWAMIALAVLVHLPTPVVTVVGVVMIAAHNLFDPIRASSLGALAPFWNVLHSPGIVVGQPHLVFAAYPLVPWVGVTAAGYGLGRVYSMPAEERRRLLWRLGISLSAAFVLLRATNIYGDLRPWTAQSSFVYTALSFLNTNKYPPSLLFLLMTLGPALSVLAAIDGATPRWLRPALVFGRVPLFYYLVHLALIHLLAVVVCAVRYGGDTHWMFESPSLDRYPFTPPPGWGFSLPIVYLVWFSVVVALYPLCRWFAGVKQRRDDAWLSFM